MARILIAEDDREIAMPEKDYMEINGFEAVIAEDGIKAMELLEKEAFDLIVLDIMMPGKNGYDI